LRWFIGLLLREEITSGWLKRFSADCFYQPLLTGRLSSLAQPCPWVGFANEQAQRIDLFMLFVNLLLLSFDLRPLLIERLFQAIILGFEFFDRLQGEQRQL
jgi:hypothetical protein